MIEGAGGLTTDYTQWATNYIETLTVNSSGRVIATTYGGSKIDVTTSAEFVVVEDDLGITCTNGVVNVPVTHKGGSASYFFRYKSTNPSGTTYYTVTEVITVQGHSYDEVFVAPTCTEVGYTNHVCPICGDNYATDEVPATGHIKYSHSGMAHTCTETGLTEMVECSICGVALIPQEVIPANGHSYDGNICSICGYENMGDETPGETLIPLVGTNLKLGGELAMNFFIDPDDLSGTDYYAVITLYADGDTITTTIPYDQWEQRTSYTVVTLNGLAARQMADNISIVLYTGDGVQASVIWTDSIRSYAMRVLEKQSDKAKTMLVDMLNYGAAAQNYFSYNTDDLANNQLTEAQQAYATQSVSCTDQRVMGTNYFGSSLKLESEIRMTMYFQNITPDMYAVISFADHHGDTHLIRVEGSEFVQYNSTTYGVVIDELVVADGNQLVTVKVYDADGNQMAYAIDSINSYAVRMKDRNVLFELVTKFTTSAYAYFH